MTSDEILKIPKVVLHTHLEGSMTPATLRELSDRNGVKLSFDPFSKNIYEPIQANNWETFRKIYFEICSSYHNDQDFYDALYNYGKSLAKQNVRYAEVQFSPWKHLSRGVSLDHISKGFINAVNDLEQAGLITIRLICDLVRNKEEKSDYILDWLKELPRNLFVALGVSGGSNAVPRKDYAKYCERAKNWGYNITAHAGEIEGPGSVKEIIDYFHADRIGHGIRSKEDPSLFDSLKKSGIHFEICPTANRIIGLCRNSFDPIREIIAEQINFSINTDDELIFDTDITQEISILLDVHAMSPDEILMNQRNALLNSFLDNETKTLLLKKMFP
jgi:adenosine deaminase